MAKPFVILRPTAAQATQATQAIVDSATGGTPPDTTSTPTSLPNTKPPVSKGKIVAAIGGAAALIGMAVSVFMGKKKR